MSVRMIILLGIFVWAPLMGFLAWKYARTFTHGQRSRSTKRRISRALLLANDGQMSQERRRIRRSF